MCFTEIWLLLLSLCVFFLNTLALGYLADKYEYNVLFLYQTPGELLFDSD